MGSAAQKVPSHVSGITKPKHERLSRTSSGDDFIRGDEQGRIKERLSVGKSLAAARRVESKAVAKPGYGDP